MMDVRPFLNKNAATLLATVAVAGTITSIYLAVQAGIKTKQTMSQMEDDGFDKPDKEMTKEGYKEASKVYRKMLFQNSWKHYIPVVVAGGITVAAITMSHTVSVRKQAALAGLYAVTERAYSTYKDEVREVLTKGKREEVEAKVAEKMMVDNPGYKEIIITDEDTDVTMMDSISGRYIKSSVEKVRKAMNDVNQDIFSDQYASLNDFWQAIGLPTTNYGGEVGWNIDSLIDIDFVAAMTPDGKPCISIFYKHLPWSDYCKF